jgi:hypothetical protein
VVIIGGISPYPIIIPFIKPIKPPVPKADKITKTKEVFKVNKKPDITADIPRIDPTETSIPPVIIIIVIPIAEIITGDKLNKMLVKLSIDKNFAVVKEKIILKKNIKIRTVNSLLPKILLSTIITSKQLVI